MSQTPNLHQRVLSNTVTSLKLDHNASHDELKTQSFIVYDKVPPQNTAHTQHISKQNLNRDLSDEPKLKDDEIHVMVYAKSNSIKENKLFIAGENSSEEEKNVDHVIIVEPPKQKLSSHIETYKPPRAEANLFSAFSIKPQVKQDVISQKNLINRKYTISKKAQNIYQNNHIKKKIENLTDGQTASLNKLPQSTLIKTMPTMEKVESLLNNTQRSNYLIRSNQFVNIRDASKPITAKIQSKKVEQFGIVQYDHNGQPMSENVYTLSPKNNQKKLNKTLISQKNYAGHTVPKQPGFERKSSPKQLLKVQHLHSSGPLLQQLPGNLPQPLSPLSSEPDPLQIDHFVEFAKKEFIRQSCKVITQVNSPKEEIMNIIESRGSANMSTQLQNFENICVSVEDKEIINSKQYNVLKIVDQNSMFPIPVVVKHEKSPVAQSSQNSISQFVKRKAIQIKRTPAPQQQDNHLMDLKISNTPLNQQMTFSPPKVVMPGIQTVQEELQNVLNMPLTHFYGPNGEPPLIIVPDSNKTTIDREEKKHFYLSRNPKFQGNQSKQKRRLSSFTGVTVYKKEIEDRIFSRKEVSESEEYPQSRFSGHSRKNTFLKSSKNIKSRTNSQSNPDDLKVIKLAKHVSQNDQTTCIMQSQNTALTLQILAPVNEETGSTRMGKRPKTSQNKNNHNFFFGKPGLQIQSQMRQKPCKAEHLALNKDLRNTEMGVQTRQSELAFSEKSPKNQFKPIKSRLNQQSECDVSRGYNTSKTQILGRETPVRPKTSQNRTTLSRPQSIKKPPETPSNQFVYETFHLQGISPSPLADKINGIQIQLDIIASQKATLNVDQSPLPKPINIISVTDDESGGTKEQPRESSRFLKKSTIICKQVNASYDPDSRNRFQNFSNLDMKSCESGSVGIQSHIKLHPKNSVTNEEFKGMKNFSSEISLTVKRKVSNIEVVNVPTLTDQEVLNFASRPKLPHTLNENHDYRKMNKKQREKSLIEQVSNEQTKYQRKAAKNTKRIQQYEQENQLAQSDPFILKKYNRFNSMSGKDIYKGPSRHQRNYNRVVKTVDEFKEIHQCLVGDGNFKNKYRLFS